MSEKVDGMNNLTETFNAAVVVSGFVDYYKARSKIRDQEERRQQLLHEQKRNRRELLNKTRDLVGLNDGAEGQDLLEEPMELSVTKSPKKRPYCGVLMMSEWLLQVPSDLDSHWFVVPCPVGKRTLVVSTRRGTKAYDKRGYPVATFRSVLPMNSMLDCIWSKERHTYFVLDVLKWNNQTLLDCETDFRCYWIETKFQQESSKATHKSADNPFPFLPLPYKRCTIDTVGEMMSGLEIPGGSLDGLLFYHSETHYTAGSTPLVTWLKPHMVPEVLGVEVHPQYLEERPPDYENLAVYVQKTENAKHSKKSRNHSHKKRNKPVKMETECGNGGLSAESKHHHIQEDSIESECNTINEEAMADAILEDVSPDSHIT